MVFLIDRPLGETSSLPRWALLDRCGRQRRGPWKSEARGRWGTGAAGEATAREQEQGGEGEEILWQPFRRSFGAHFRLVVRQGFGIALVGVCVASSPIM